MFWIIVENWKANDVFNTLADNIVNHCVVKTISDLFGSETLVLPQEGLDRQAGCVSRR